ITLLSIDSFAQVGSNPSKFNNGIQFPNETSVSTESVTGFAIRNEDGTYKDYLEKDSVIQFSASQKDRILDLIYQPNASLFSVSPASGERGVSTSLTVSYWVTPNDDEDMTGSINQGIGSITIDGSSHDVSGGSSGVSKTFTMTLNYERQGEAEEETKTATYTAYIPQWKGVSDEDAYTTYAGIDLTKFIQSSATTTMEVSPSAEYVWFISNKSNATVLDGNNFVQTVGTWGDGTSEFYSKSLSLTLADGITTATVYLYRSRNTK